MVMTTIFTGHMTKPTVSKQCQPEGVMDDDTGDKGDNELVCACVRVCVCEIR